MRYKELEEKVAQALRIEKEREEVITYFYPYLKQWVELQYEVRLLTYDDVHERYWIYDGIRGENVHFTSPAIRDYSFQDSIIMDEEKVSIPLDFINSGREAYKAKLEAVKEEQVKRAQANRAQILRRQAEAATSRARQLEQEAKRLVQ